MRVGDVGLRVRPALPGPHCGMAIGAASGALAGHLSDYGMDDKWIKEVAGSIPPGGSALSCHGAQHQSRAGVAGDGQVRRHRAQDNLTSEQQQALESALQPST